MNKFYVQTEEIVGIRGRIRTSTADPGKTRESSKKKKKK